MRVLLVVVSLLISACAPSTDFYRSTDYLQQSPRSCAAGQTNHCLSIGDDFDCACVLDDPALDLYRRDLTMQQRSFRRGSARH
jgi:hypothetical protein